MAGLTHPYPFSVGPGDYSYKTGRLGNIFLAGLEFTPKPRDGGGGEVSQGPQQVPGVAKENMCQGL